VNLVAPAGEAAVTNFPVTWFDSGFIVVPATRSLRRVLELAADASAVWVVIRRVVDGAPVPLCYVLRTGELAELGGRFPERTAWPVEDALELADDLVSGREAGRAARTSLFARPDAPWSRRLVQIDADDTVVAVGAAEASASERGADTLGYVAGPAGSLAESDTDLLDLGTFRSAGGTHAVGLGSDASTSPEIDVELSAQAPAELAVGQEGAIEVQAALAGAVAALASSLPASVRVRTGEKIAVLLSIRGDAVVAVDAPLIRLDAPTPAKPASLWAFAIRAERAGVAQAAVVFRQGGTELGSIVFPLRVVAAKPGSGRVGGQVVAADFDPTDRNGVLLLVDDVPLAGGCAYRYRLVCDGLGWDHLEFQSPILKESDGGAAANARRYVESVYRRVTERALRNRNDAGLFAREVKGVGTDLARQLFPPELVRLLWDRRADIGVVEVKSWEPYIPWEIVRLEHPDTRVADERYLAEYGLVRSLNGASRPQRLALVDWRYLVADFPNGLELPLTAERAVFTELARQRGIAATPIAPEPDRVYDALNTPDFDVLHICCHGKAEHDDIEQSVLILGDRLRQGVAEPFLVDATTVRSEARLEARHPVVFLNACESGRLGPSLTAWSGWPRTFWDAGAGVFVGTSWPVRDVPARAFCEAFYGALIDGRTLAAAASEGRSAAKASGDATWLAYKVYGRPATRAG
jgi:hypothetical protein